MKQMIVSTKAPRAIGPYSQAIKVGNTVYISGQIPIVPETLELIPGDFKSHARQVFENLKSVAEAAGGSLSHIVRLTIYLTRTDDYDPLNEIMTQYYQEPYPARTVVIVKELPKSAPIEMDAIMVLGE